MFEATTFTGFPSESFTASESGGVSCRAASFCFGTKPRSTRPSVYRITTFWLKSALGTEPFASEVTALLATATICSPPCLDFFRGIQAHHPHDPLINTSANHTLANPV